MSNLINKIFGGNAKRQPKNNPTIEVDNRASGASEIGKPFLVKHNVHVGFNPSTGKIEGLPTPWMDLLDANHITKTEQSENPKAVIDALKVYAYSFRKKPDKYMANQQLIDNETEEIEHMIPGRGPKGSDRSTDSSDDLLTDINNEMQNKNFFDTSGDKTPNDHKKTEDKTKVKPKEQTSEPNKDQNGETNVVRRHNKKPEIKVLTEEEVMAKLKSIVNNGNPKTRYKIIKKIGSGASGTVFTAVDNVTQDKVAIKTMDLAQQPKKELIITEILVMKENQLSLLIVSLFKCL